jgi:hypothetical protein
MNAESSDSGGPTRADMIVAFQPLVDTIASLPGSLLAREESELVYASLLDAIAFYLNEIAIEDEEGWQAVFQRELMPLIDKAVETGDFAAVDSFLMTYYLSRLNLDAGDEATSSVISDVRTHLYGDEGAHKASVDVFVPDLAHGITMQDIPSWWTAVEGTDILLKGGV